MQTPTLEALLTALPAPSVRVVRIEADAANCVSVVPATGADATDCGIVLRVPAPGAPFCEVCEEGPQDFPPMVLAIWHGEIVCTDCLQYAPGRDDDEEAVACWVERYWPITTCPRCQCRTHTAQDPQGPDGVCAACREVE
jgi:hypothetical protein